MKHKLLKVFYKNGRNCVSHTYCNDIEYLDYALAYMLTLKFEDKKFPTMLINDCDYIRTEEVKHS